MRKNSFSNIPVKESFDPYHVISNQRLGVIRKFTDCCLSRSVTQHVLQELILCQNSCNIMTLLSLQNRPLHGCERVQYKQPGRQSESPWHPGLGQRQHPHKLRQNRGTLFRSADWVFVLFQLVCDDNNHLMFCWDGYQ